MLIAGFNAHLVTVAVKHNLTTEDHFSVYYFW